jgi:hypothetical protein
MILSQCAILASTDMRPHMAVAAVILILGAALMGWLQSPASPSIDRIGIPAVLFLCGPAIPFLMLTAHALWISPSSYVTFRDYLMPLLPMLLIGSAAGAVWAGAFLAGVCLRSRRGRSTK